MWYNPSVHISNTVTKAGLTTTIHDVLAFLSSLHSGGQRLLKIRMVIVLLISDEENITSRGWGGPGPTGARQSAAFSPWAWSTLGLEPVAAHSERIEELLQLALALKGMGVVVVDAVSTTVDSCEM
jgi:hypothetical protein